MSRWVNWLLIYTYLYLANPIIHFCMHMYSWHYLLKVRDPVKKGFHKIWWLVIWLNFGKCLAIFYQPHFFHSWDLPMYLIFFQHGINYPYFFISFIDCCFKNFEVIAFKLVDHSRSDKTQILYRLIKNSLFQSENYLYLFVFINIIG